MNPCPCCGEPFVRRDPRAKYCSSECQVRAKDLRRRDRKKPARRIYETQKRQERSLIDPVARAVFSDFYDLVRQKPTIKQRKCLRCSKEFRSHDHSRLCANCKRSNSNSPKLTGEVYEV